MSKNITLALLSNLTLIGVRGQIQYLLGCSPMKILLLVACRLCPDSILTFRDCMWVKNPLKSPIIAQHHPCLEMFEDITFNKHSENMGSKNVCNRTFFKTFNRKHLQNVLN